MLKISISENETKRQMVLEGKLIEPWTNELKIVGQQAVLAGDDRELIIDLRRFYEAGPERPVSTIAERERNKRKEKDVIRFEARERARAGGRT